MSRKSNTTKTSPPGCRLNKAHGFFGSAKIALNWLVANGSELAKIPTSELGAINHESFLIKISFEIIQIYRFRIVGLIIILFEVVRTEIANRKVFLANSPTGNERKPRDICGGENQSND